MTTLEEVPESKNKKISELVDKFKTLPITPDEALEIMTTLKTAIQNGDEKYVGALCTRLGSDVPGFEPSKTCEDLLGMETNCESTLINYVTPESDDSNPEYYINFLKNKTDICNHAYIYVDSEFEGFLDKDVDYLLGKKITTIDIIRQPEGKTIYKGELGNKIETAINKEKREGWFILIGVIIFIAMGILIRSRMH
jgi:hypothetical protein